MAPTDTEIDQGWSVRLSREVEEIAKSIAEREERSVKVVVERAIRAYAAKSR
jgi:predicted transcriptional regulator